MKSRMNRMNIIPLLAGIFGMGHKPAAKEHTYVCPKPGGIGNLAVSMKHSGGNPEGFGAWLGGSRGIAFRRKLARIKRNNAKG